MRILVAEDEKELRDLLQLNLEKEGYSVLCAKDGREALELLQRNKIDLCIFDIMMPFLDGLSLLRKIREFSRVPIILLTARGEEVDKVIGFSMGADDYLVKPFSMAELLARVTAVLRRSQEYSAPKKVPELKAKDFILDTDACCIRREGIATELNAKEYFLLKFFMENQEKVFTKKQIYSTVWEEDYFYDDNTIMVHISRLRNKLEADPQNPQYIKTVKGIGYKFCGR